MHDRTTTQSAQDASADASSPRSVTSRARELEHRIIAAGRRLHRARVELLQALADYDRSGRWALAGSPSCARWIADQLGVNVATAREWLRIAHALVALPLIAGAFERGDLSYAKVRTLTRVAVDHPDHQQELVELCSPVPADEVGHRLAGWCHGHEDPETRDRRERRHTSLSHRVEPDGMHTLTLRGPALLVTGIAAAVDARVMQGVDVPSCAATAPERERGREQEWERERPSLGQQRAYGLNDVCTNGAGARVVTEILVHVRGDGCSLSDGTPIDDHVVASLLGEAFIRALVHDADGRPINASGRQRHPTVRQQRVVQARHPVCVDCGGTELLEFDHDPPFQVSHRTVVDELTRRCAGCHRRRHEPPPSPRG